MVRGKLVDKFVPPIIQTSVDFRDFEELFCVFTHVASIYANLLEQKKAFNERKESERKKERKRSKESVQKSSTPTGLVWDTNMAAVSKYGCYDVM